MKIVVATKNKGKIKEIIKFFQPLQIDIVSMAEFEPLPEAVEDGHSFNENALIKAKFYGDLLKLPCLADDSGLMVKQLNDEPGVYSARYAGPKATDEENNQKLIRELNKLNIKMADAAYGCAMALYFPASGKVLTSYGECPGKIITQARGEGGFGYDPYFYLPEYDKTVAEISMDLKNEISHRGKALQKMVKEIQDGGLC